MSNGNGLDKSISVFLSILLRDSPIWLIKSALNEIKEIYVEDQDIKAIAEKIKQTEIELSHASNR